MSLFKSRVWWEINLNEPELYDSRCMLIFRLDKDENQSVLLGNHEGLLRLFSPYSDILQEGFSGFKPSQLLLEVKLPAPILQINEGALVSISLMSYYGTQIAASYMGKPRRRSHKRIGMKGGSRKKYIAILHPRLFSVYEIKKKQNEETNVGYEMIIEIAYEHVLRHSAHSFVLGSFGGVGGRTFACIQSLDGLLSFYEQEFFAFQIYLPKFILPFTFIYLEKTDSFLFLNGFLTLDCYSYESLASGGNSNDKKIMKSWEYNLGEGILDINKVARDGLNIIILSERNLYALNENGKLLFMKRLEYKPIAFCCYATENKRLMVVIATDDRYLNLYDETNLKWAMKIDQIPVSVDRVFLKNLPGGLILLSEDGYLQVVYIGTHPSVYLIPSLIQPEIDYVKAENELKQLQQKIADNDLEDPVIADLVSVELKIDKNLKIEKDVRICNVMIEITTQCLLGKIQVLLLVDSPLVATNHDTVITNCSEKAFIESCVYLNRSGVVSNLEFTVVVTYKVNEGMARSIQKKGQLPLGLVVVETAAVKEAQYKVTIATNKSVCAINQLFREFTIEENSPHAIGLKFLNSDDVVSILAAKSSQRYRLQSDCLEAITLPLIVLIEKLKYQFRKDSDFSLNYTSALPLDIFFDRISHHHSLLTELKVLEEELCKQNSQYRMIQKKILMNMKDVTPKPASNLNRISKDTSLMITVSLGKLETMEEDLVLSRCYLSSMSRLLVTLLELMSVAEKDLEYLRIVFSPHVQDFEKQGWLEVQEAAASFLLRTRFAKSAKDQQKPTDILLERMKDVSKLSKHFSSVIDRVTKGTHLLERNEYENKKEPLSTIQSIHEEENFSDDIIPAGFKFVALDLPKTESTKSVIKLTKPIPEEKENFEEKEIKNVEIALDPEVELPKKEGIGTPQSTIPAEYENNQDDDEDSIWDVKIEEMRI